MARKKPPPDAPLASNPFRALAPMRRAMEESAAEAPAPPAPVARPSHPAPEVWRPDLERELFAVAMAGVQPLSPAASPRVGAGVTPARARPVDAVKTRRAQAEGGAQLVPAHGEDGSVQAAHRGGSFAIEALTRYASPDDTLDLHGLGEPEAILRTQEFVRTRAARRMRCVLIVCGRGRHASDGAAVLRDVVVRTLCAPPTSGALDAFASAPDSLGGVGAILVSLRR